MQLPIHVIVSTNEPFIRYANLISISFKNIRIHVLWIESNSRGNAYVLSYSQGMIIIKE